MHKRGRVWEMPENKQQPTNDERDEPVSIPLDPEQALRGRLNVDPDDLVPQDEPVKNQGDREGVAQIRLGKLARRSL